MDGDDKLTVRSSDLFHAAHQVASARSAIDSATKSAYGSFGADAAGWIGDSKKALEKAVTEMQEQSTKMLQELEARSERIDYAGRRYADTERRNAERQKKSGKSDNPSLNMDH